VLGGSVAYGYAVALTDTIEVFLERALRAAAGSDRFTVVNLAYNAQGAYAFAPTLRDYRYLQCDLAILFEGYNDLRDDPQNLLVFRRASPVFRLTGYLPIFPMVFREKAAALMHGGDVSALYESSGRRVFRPTWAARTEAGALRTASRLDALVERQLDRIDRPPSRPEQVRGANMCAAAPAYCRSIAAAIDEARSAGMQVLVATQPYVIGATRTAHVEQQQEMADMLARRYGTDRAVQYVNLGDALDLSDPALSVDAMHPTAIGNARLAAAFTRPVLAMAAAR